MSGISAPAFRTRSVLALWLLALAAIPAFAESDPFPLWPDGAPGALGSEPRDIPTLQPFLPDPARATGAAVVVCPGGGYAGLAAHEADPVAEWLRSNGIAGFVLRYRHAPAYRDPAPLLDAQRAIRTVRTRAAEWGVDPARIGILGFSAGGHLASSAAVHFDAGDPDAADPVDRASSRPDLAILIYPVITMRDFGHAGSRRNLLGENPSEEDVARFSNDERVTEATPPAFLVHGADDKPVPVENSYAFARALARAGVPHELHVFERGPHGFGLGDKSDEGPKWTPLCETWLRTRGFR